MGTVTNLKRLVEGAWTAGLTVAYALHHSNIGGDYDGWKFLNPSHKGTRDLGLFEAGSFGVQVHPDVAPQPGDIMAREHWTASGFAGTDLDVLLSQRGIDRVVIAGSSPIGLITSWGDSRPRNSPRP
ncbi:cysteine hydrolase family protein [Candidatus Poriferisodalis sp.]|uniref:cysteine hydrolase family protein n=1 Tax=Candidatus Poriferisodalis sp. TaxID=3101277 RepID=UPI003AF594D2